MKARRALPRDARARRPRRARVRAGARARPSSSPRTSTQVRQGLKGVVGTADRARMPGAAGGGGRPTLKNRGPPPLAAVGRAPSASSASRSRRRSSSAARRWRPRPAGLPRATASARLAVRSARLGDRVRGAAKRHRGPEDASSSSRRAWARSRRPRRATSPSAAAEAQVTLFVRARSTAPGSTRQFRKESASATPEDRDRETSGALRPRRRSRAAPCCRWSARRTPRSSGSRAS